MESVRSTDRSPLITDLSVPSCIKEHQGRIQIVTGIALGILGIASMVTGVCLSVPNQISFYTGLSFFGLGIGTVFAGGYFYQRGSITVLERGEDFNGIIII